MLTLNYPSINFKNFVCRKCILFSVTYKSWKVLNVTVGSLFWPRVLFGVLTALSCRLWSRRTFLLGLSQQKSLRGKGSVSQESTLVQTDSHYWAFSSAATPTGDISEKGFRKQQRQKASSQPLSPSALRLSVSRAWVPQENQRIETCSHWFFIASCIPFSLILHSDPKFSLGHQQKDRHWWSPRHRRKK